MRRWQQLATAGTGLLALGAMTVGGVVNEDPDAGDLPGTALPVEAASAVEGSLPHTTDADVYRVCAGEGGLTASTVGGTALDTVLYLFDADGRALAMNDDAGGTWQSEVSVPGAAAGTYLVAVSAFGFPPVSTTGTAMFNRGVPTAADAVLGGWSAHHPETGAYRLSLTGAVECQAPVTAPVPVALDVHPGSANSSINTRSRGRTPMALLSVGGVEVADLAAASIEVGPAGAAPVKVQVADIDSDGVADLLLHVRTSDLGLEAGSQDLCVTAAPEEGPAVQGCETIEVR